MLRALLLNVAGTHHLHFTLRYIPLHCCFLGAKLQLYNKSGKFHNF